MSSHLKKVARRYEEYCRSIGMYEKKYLEKKSDPHIFSEAKLSNVWRHANKIDSGFIIVSAAREGIPENKKENIKRHKHLINYVKSYDLGYFVLDGHWIENEGTSRQRPVDELSLFIPYMKDVMSVMEFEEWALHLMEKYDQEGILLKLPGDKNIIEIYEDGRRELRNTFRSTEIGDFYSRIRGRPDQSFTFEGVENPASYISVGIFKRRNQLWY